MREKFVSTTNIGLNNSIPKEVWGNLEINRIALWRDFSSPKYFHTSLIRSYIYNEQSKLLNIETANSEYVFRLEEDPKAEEMNCASQEDQALVDQIRHQNAHELFTHIILRIGCYSGESYDEEIVLNPPLSYYKARERFIGTLIRDTHENIIGEIRFVIPLMPDLE